MRQNYRPSREDDVHPAPEGPPGAVTPNSGQVPAGGGGPSPRKGRTEPRHTRGHGLAHMISASHWPVVVILLIQATLSIRLFWSNTNFQDEGLYLWAGYLQFGHHAQSAQIQGLETWFSGSPAIYPLLGAQAARIGGLVGARLLSLVFMLLATTALYAVTRRLWSSRMPAVFAAALFGWLGSAQFLGAFATYDAMSLALLALATWLGVRAVPCRKPGYFTLLAAAAAFLLLANATKYMTILYDPVVIAVVGIAIWRIRGWAYALAGGCAMAAVTAVLVLGAYRLSGAYYAAGIKYSTLSRSMGDISPEHVLAASGRWIGFLVVLALVAAMVMTWQHRDAATALLAWLLAGAALLAPVEEARLHTTVSLYKHVGFGAWFASAAAGWLLAYGFESYERGSPRNSRRFRCTAWLGTVIAVAAAAIGVVTAGTQFHDWPNSSGATAELTRFATPHGEYLAEDYDQFTYALRASILIPQWWNTWSFSYLDPRTEHRLANNAGYAAAIRDRYFGVVILDFQDTIGTDQAIEQDMKKYHDYRLAAMIPFTTSAGPGDYVVWVPTPRPTPRQHHR